MWLRLYKSAVLSVIVLAGCRTDMPMSEQRHAPKHPRFSLQPADYSATDLLDFNAVYYTVQDVPVKGGTWKAYNYFRFWPTGHVLSDFSDHLPVRSDAEDFSHAFIGFFRLDGRNIVMELFAPDTGQWRWDYGREYGVIEDGAIAVTNSQIGARSWTNREVFRRHHIDGLERKPDW